jgi:putative ATP-binding cassette transporter
MKNNLINKALGQVKKSPRSVVGGIKAGLSNVWTGMRYYYRIGSPYWYARENWIQAWSLLTIVMVAMYAQVKLNVMISDATQQYITSIALKEADDVRQHLLYLCIRDVVAVSVVSVAYNYCLTRLAIQWRWWEANDFLSRYFSNHAYLKLLKNKKVDNPNQRMSQDIDSFCNNVVWLLIPLLSSLVNIYEWSYLMWTLAGSTSITWIGFEWNVSHLLTYGVIVAALMGNAFIIVIGRPLMPLTNQQMRTEGDLRNILQEIAQDAQSIALYRGEDMAHLQTKNKLEAVIKTLTAIMNTNRNINLFNTTFNGLVPFIAPWFIGGLYVTGAVEKFGVITQAGMAVVALVGALTTIMSQFPGLASFFAILFRLGTLDDAMAEAKIDRLPADKRIRITSGEDFIMKNLSLLGDDLKTFIVKNINCELKKGESLLIIGKNGSGTTTLFHTLAGIHNAGTGDLQRLPFDHVMVIDENPYLAELSIREAIGYPCTDACANDEEIRRVLRMVRLEDLEKRLVEVEDGSQEPIGLDTPQKWHQILSLSEQQRLSLARILFKSPAVAMIDKATSALDQNGEALMIAKLTGDGKTLINISDNDRHVASFTKVMVLAEDGTATVSLVSEYKPKDEK